MARSSSKSTRRGTPRRCATRARARRRSRGCCSGSRSTAGSSTASARGSRNCSASRRRPIMLRDLLTMSSCLECNDWDEESPGNEELMYPQEDWLGFALGLPLRETTGFSYCTAGVVALGITLERALGEPLSDFARRELFDPLGIERAEWQHTPRGETSTAGGLELDEPVTAPPRRALLEGRRGPRPTRVGHRVDPGACAHRRRHGVRLPVVAARSTPASEPSS